MFLACFVFINLGFVHLLAKLPFRSVTTTGVPAIGCGKELFSISIDVRSVAALSKCLVSRHSLKSFTDNQNWHDILQKYYIKFQTTPLRERKRKRRELRNAKRYRKLSVTKHFLLQP